MIELMLPMPPSVNALYFNRKGPTKSIAGKKSKQRGRIITPKYAAWIEEAGWALRSHGGCRIEGDVIVKYTLGPRCKQSDVFNREKALSDLLVKHGVIEDDKKIVKGTVAWADIEGCRVEIWPA